MNRQERESQQCEVEEAQTPPSNRLTTENSFVVLGHEIRNPLSALSYALEAWPTSQEDPQLAEHLLQIMRRQVGQLTRLCNDLLDSGRITQGSLSVVRAKIDLRDALKNACEEVRPFIERCGHSMSVELGGVPLTMQGDASRLTQVIANLVHNASKFTDRGGHVHVSLKREEDSAVVQIRDNGRGICNDRLMSLFRAEKAAVRCSEPVGEGLGIGLRLAKAIVELHGGTIEAMSDGLGRGCTFLVRLPLIKETSNDASKFASKEAFDGFSQPVESDSGKDLRIPQYRIVVVDDDRAIRFLMARLLERLNQSVAVAENGDMAIDTILRLRPDVVFLDLQMHGKDGYEVARHIRRLGELPHVVLIALTGSADAESRKLAAEAGFDHYLVKPTSLAELTETLLHVEERVRGFLGHA